MQDHMEQSTSLTPERQIIPIWKVPPQLTSLIGRERETAHISALLINSEVRLLTLLGPGGIGKTRLSIEVATHLRPHFADGIYFVSLASIADPSLVLFAIAQAFDLQESEEQSLTEQLATYLQGRRVLLLLDNFEQLQAAALLLTDLLADCPNMKLLVISRAALRIQGEQEFLIQPLALPPLDQHLSPEKVTEYAAVALFLQRVQALIPDFQITQTNAQAIAEICVQLDGLPLALELAAARMKLLSPASLLSRLSHRLQVLTGGARTLPVRQQTLYNTLKWSYDLLDPQEQQLFQRLAVFVNGCTLQAIEAIYTRLGDDANQVMDRVALLIDKCLLRQMESDSLDPRLGMLETIREYALERLSAGEETQAVRYAHACYYLALAEEIEPKLDGEGQDIGMKHLESERDNLRTAYLWLSTQAENAQEQDRNMLREMALRLAGSQRRLWLMRGYRNDEQSSLERTLSANEAISERVRAKALLTLGMLVSRQGNHSRAEEIFRECLLLFRRLHEPRNIATILYQLGRIAWMSGDHLQARILAEEALTYSKESGHKGSIAWSLFRLARLVTDQGEYTQGQALFEENLALHKEASNKRGMASALYELAWIHLVNQSNPEIVHTLIVDAQTLFREIGDKDGIAYCLYLSGWLALNQNDTDLAQSLLQESLSLFKAISSQDAIAWTYYMLGKVAASKGNYLAAYTAYREAIEIAGRMDYKGLLTTSLEGLASLVAGQEENPVDKESDDGRSDILRRGGEAQPNAWWAARLWGTSEALRQKMGITIFPIDRASHQRTVAIIRKQLGEEFFAIALSEGHNMLPAQALTAQKKSPLLPQPSRVDAKAARTALPDGLTLREVEVLKLVAHGLTSAQIATQLTLSLLTVNSHVRSIYSKLNITSRSAATRYAIEHKLI